MLPRCPEWTGFIIALPFLDAPEHISTYYWSKAINWVTLPLLVVNQPWSFLNTYTHIHTHTHAHTHTCTHMQAHAHTHTCTRIHTHSCIHHTHTHAHTKHTSLMYMCRAYKQYLQLHMFCINSTCNTMTRKMEEVSFFLNNGNCFEGNWFTDSATELALSAHYS